MKCPKCGGESIGRFCQFCGSELPYNGPQNVNSGNSTINSNNITQNVTNIYYVNRAPAAPNGYVPVMYETGPAVSGKNKSAALLLCFFLGVFGGHLFYAGRWKKGLLYLFTGGIVCIGWFIDIFVIAFNKFTDADGLPITGHAVAAKRIIYLTMCLSGLVGMADTGNSSGSGYAGLLVAIIFGALFVLSLIRKR